MTRLKKSKFVVYSLDKAPYVTLRCAGVDNVPDAEYVGLLQLWTDAQVLLGRSHNHLIVAFIFFMVTVVLAGLWGVGYIPDKKSVYILLFPLACSVSLIGVAIRNFIKTCEKGAEATNLYFQEVERVIKTYGE